MEACVILRASGLWLAIAVLLIPGLAWAQGAGDADPGPAQVEMKLDQCRLVWRAHHGLDIEYGGVPVFAGYPQELTLHTRDWREAQYKSSLDRGRTRLSREGDAQVLTIEHDANGFRWTETISAGPDDRFRIAYTYLQDGWDDASLQLGFSRPLEHWFAGAAFTVDTDERRPDGIIPVQFDAARPQPFTEATKIAITSMFGRIEMTASAPVSLFDYQDRDGCLWLGRDEPLPRGQQRTFAVEASFSPAVVEQSGIIVSQLKLPAEVDDGRIAVALSLRAAAGGPDHVQVTLAGTSPAGDSLQSRAEAALQPQQEALVELALPATVPGTYPYRLTVTANPGGGELFASKEVSAKVAPAMTILPGRSVYTDETDGCLLVKVSRGLQGQTLRFMATTPNGLNVEASVRGGARTRVPLNLAKLPEGATVVTGRLCRGAQILAIASVAVRKASPKPNEVKIDYESRGLIVDGLPWLPFGFYCIFPATGLAETEAPQGFNMIAAYQDANRDFDQIRAYLDRCAQVGMRVHYDIRAIAQAEPSAAKWEALRREVEAFRDHPALLAWYLCDEPDGQKIPPARLVEAYDFIKQLDPYHPITMVFCMPAKAIAYVDAMDIMMADPYPIPDAPVSTVADWADQLNRAVDYGMPLWIVPQAFGGGEWWKREPSAREERAMTYLALVHDATGIQYFVRRAPVGNPISPSLWNECRRLALETHELAPVVLSAEAAPVSAEPATIHVTTRKYRGAVYIIAVNESNAPSSLGISLSPKRTGEAEVLFESRTVRVADGKLRDLIDGFGTRVYRLPYERASESVAVSPASLTVNPSFEDTTNPGTPDGCYVTVGKDPGASLLVDPGVARHGSHSLRLCTPVDGGGVRIRPFPVRLEKGRRYTVSVYGKGRTEGLHFRLALDGIDAEPQTLTLGREWTKYVFSGTAGASGPGQVTLELTSAGTAWFDLLQVIPQ
jgi:hypothetical protein